MFQQRRDGQEGIRRRAGSGADRDMAAGTAIAAGLPTDQAAVKSGLREHLALFGPVSRHIGLSAFAVARDWGDVRTPVVARPNHHSTHGEVERWSIRRAP